MQKNDIGRAADCTYVGYLKSVDENIIQLRIDFYKPHTSAYITHIYARKKYFFKTLKFCGEL